MKKSLWFAAIVAIVISAGCDKNKGEDVKDGDNFIEQNTGEVNEAAQFPVSQLPVEPVSPDKVVATVNGAEILQGEVSRIVDMQLSQYGAQMPEAFVEQMRANMQSRVLEMLIAQRLMLADATEREIEVSEDELTARIDEITSTLPEGLTLDAVLADANTTIEVMRSEIGNNMKIEKLLDAVLEGKPVNITDETALNFYNEKKAEHFTKPEQAHASHILISPEDVDDDKSWADAKKKVDAIALKLKEGADFAALAKESSACSSSENGGDLGQFGRGEMVAEFEEAAFSQELNVVGEPVKTKYGFHLIKVSQRTAAGETPFDEVKEEIIENLEDAAKNELVSNYIDELKAKADLKIIE